MDLLKRKLYKRKKTFILVLFGIAIILILITTYYKVYILPSKDTKVVNKVYKEDRNTSINSNTPTASINNKISPEVKATKNENNNFPVINTDKNKAPFLNK